MASQLTLARGILHQMEISHGMRVMSPLEEWLERSSKHALDLASLECTIARLRSRVDCLKEGDANMKLFHQHAR